MGRADPVVGGLEPELKAEAVDVECLRNTEVVGWQRTNARLCCGHPPAPLTQTSAPTAVIVSRTGSRIAGFHRGP
jgi:hypothetical protein